MRGLNLINLLTTLILIISVNEIKAETATTGNLLPNAGSGFNSTSQNPANNGSVPLDSIGSANGFTTNGITDYTGGNWNELEAQGTGTVDVSGSLVGIVSEKENGGQFNITADSLDGGVSLNSITEVQNCEWIGSSSQCGSATNGQDSFSTTLKILDANNNVLATTSITRNNDAGYRENSYTYSDTITHNGTGARNWDWQWQGIDGNNINSTSAVGPNLLGASLTATLTDINFQQLTEEQTTNISSANTQIEESQTALTEVFKEVQLFTPEVNVQIAPIETQQIEIEEFKAPAIEMQQLQTMVIEQFKQIIVKENLVQEFNTALVEENITEEQFFEEVGNMMKEELNVAPEPKVKEPKMEENNVVAKKSNLEEETIKEEPKQSGEPKIENEPKQEESNASNSNSTEPKPNNTETTKEDETSSESEPEASENTEEKSTESSMDEDKKAEGEETEKTNEERLDADETGTTKETDVDSGDEKNIASSISAKVEKIIKKLENTLMTVDQKVKAVQFITLKAMSDNAPDMSSYKNQSFYSSTQLPDGNVDFFNQLNIEQTQIYKGVTLAKYTDNDPLTSQRIELDRIKTEENRLKIELEQLRKQL